MSLEKSAENLFEINSVSPDVENFYNAQGCFYQLSYTKFDFETIKNLAKLIVGNYSVPPKSSMELFGDTLKFLYAELGIEKPERRKEPTVPKKIEKPEKSIQKLSEDKDESKVEGTYS